MLDPYRMILVNSILSVLGVCGLLAFKHFFPRKKINYVLLLVLISLLPLVSLLRKGTYESGDLTGHSSMALSFFNTLKDGNIIPQWGAEFFSGLGSPNHIMAFFLVRYVTSLIHFLGFTMINSMKIYIAGMYLLSGITMYYWLKSDVGKKAAFVGAILYLFAPYHFVDMHFRVEVGELASFAILPLCFLFTKKVITEKNFKWIILNAIAMVFLILSHQAIALIAFGFIVLYAVFIKKTTKQTIQSLFRFVSSQALAIVLSCFYWGPMVFEAGKFTYIHHSTIGQTVLEFRPIQEYLFSPWRWGLLFQGNQGELSFVLGYTHILIIVVALFFVIKKKLPRKQRTTILFFLIMFFILLFLMQRISNPIWQTVPFIKYTQNTYRFLLILVFFASTVGAFLLKNTKRNLLVIALCAITIVSTILNWGNRRMIPEISEDSYLHEHAYIIFNPVKYNYDFSLPIWADPKKTPIYTRAKYPIQTIHGDAVYKQTSRNTTKHEYVVSVKKTSEIRENTLYYPGWTLYVNNSMQKINYQQKDYPGLITFSLKPGLYKVELIFENTQLRIISYMVSFFAFLLIILYVLKSILIRFTRSKG